MKVNIPASVRDDHYRYARDDLICKVESSGNGIKTKLANIENIAGSLNRNAENLCKYFSYQLSCSEKNSTLNGKHSKNTLDATLEKFIRNYVLCGKCNIPETEIISGKSQRLGLKCSSCGQITKCPNDPKFNKLIAKELGQKKKIGKKLADQNKKVKLKWISSDNHLQHDLLPVSELQKYLSDSASEFTPTKLLEYQMKCRLSDRKFMMQVVKAAAKTVNQGKASTTISQKIIEILGDFVYAPFRQLALMQVLFSLKEINNPDAIVSDLYRENYLFKDLIEQFAQDNAQHNLDLAKCL